MILHPVFYAYIVHVEATSDQQQAVGHQAYIYRSYCLTFPSFLQLLLSIIPAASQIHFLLTYSEHQSKIIEIYCQDASNA